MVWPSWLCQVYSDNGKREVQQLRSTFLDITQKLGDLSQVCCCLLHAGQLSWRASGMERQKSG